MNVFINEVNLDNFALFKAELILDIVDEMNLSDKMRESLIEEIISNLDDASML